MHVYEENARTRKNDKHNGSSSGLPHTRASGISVPSGPFLVSFLILLVPFLLLPRACASFVHWGFPAVTVLLALCPQ